jgi:flagellar biogenesis protein FliO
VKRGGTVVKPLPPVDSGSLKQERATFLPDSYDWSDRPVDPVVPVDFVRTSVTHETTGQPVTPACFREDNLTLTGKSCRWYQPVARVALERDPPSRRKRMAALVTRKSPRPYAAAGPVSVFATLRLAATCAVLLMSAVASGQDVSAFPDSPRPVRRLDAAIPVTLVDSGTSPVAPIAADLGKTPIRRVADESGDSSKPRSSWTMWAVLAVIVGTATGLSLWTRKAGTGGHWKLPSTVFQVLGRSAVGPNQSVTLLRLGERVLLVSSSGPAMQTLAVVTDPVEVATITSECLSKRSVQLADPPAKSKPRLAMATEAAAVAGMIGGDDRRVRTRPEANHA